MKPWILLLLLFVALVSGGIWLFGDGVTAPPSGLPGSAGGSASPPDGGTSQAHRSGDPSRADRTAVGDAKKGAEKSRRKAPPEPTRYRVLDAETREPLAGAHVRLVRGGELKATTDRDGWVDVPKEHTSKLAFWAPGYLLGWGAEFLGKEARRERHREIGLTADAYTIPLPLRFVASDGKPPGQVRVRLVCAEDAPPTGDAVPVERMVPGAEIERRVREVWRNHVLIARLAGFEPLGHHLGLPSNSRVFEGGAEQTLRVVATGLYRLDARSADGETARRPIRVELSRRDPLVVQLVPGHTAAGVVTCSGRPVEDAEVRVLEGTLGIEPARTRADGGFRLGPLTKMAITLRIEHPEFEPVEIGPRPPGPSAWRISLLPRPVHVLRGQVRARPRLDPVAGARVEVCVDGRAIRSARSDEQGNFNVRTAAKRCELVITTPQHERYVETVTPGEAPLVYDLFPGSAKERVAHGLTALLRGRVVGRDGKPRPQCTVRAIHENPPPLRGHSGRRILMGGLLARGDTTTSDAQGCFELELSAGGPVTLYGEDVPRPGNQQVPAQKIDVVLGTVQDNLRVVSR